jgi:hypothetical protein
MEITSAHGPVIVQIGDLPESIKDKQMKDYWRLSNIILQNKLCIQKCKMTLNITIRHITMMKKRSTDKKLSRLLSTRKMINKFWISIPRKYAIE